MSIRRRRADYAWVDVAEVRFCASSTRFLRKDNGETYHFVAKHGMSQFPDAAGIDAAEPWSGQRQRDPEEF